MRKIMAVGLMYLLSVALTGCAAIEQEYNSGKDWIFSIQDPTERGLAYIAAAILMSAIIRAIANR